MKSQKELTVRVIVKFGNKIDFLDFGKTLVKHWRLKLGLEAAKSNRWNFFPLTFNLNLSHPQKKGSPGAKCSSAERNLQSPES
jgi:hypothetical protein